MKKIIFLVLLGFFLPSHYLAGERQKPKHPNFVFILTDDQGWTSLSSAMDDRYPEARSDYFETPNMDRLGNAGMRFSCGYAPDALCTPSRRSIQFGQNTIHTGNVHFRANYDPKTKQWLTIPRMLKSIDPAYKTAHYGKWDLRAGFFPEDLGYDESDGNTGNGNGDLMTDKSTKWTQVYVNNDPKRTGTITQRAINFMQRQVSGGNPFYLQISYYATHVDIQTKKKTYQKYLQKKKGKIHDNAGWAGMLEDLDTGIGEVMDMISKLGIDNDTYIILMSDNGGVQMLPPPVAIHKLDPPSAFPKKMNNYPLRSGKWVLYEGGIRVPFMIKGPGIKPGSYCHVAVTGCDLIPTISELAGNKNPLPDYLDGSSIKPLLDHPVNGKPVRKEGALYFHRYVNAYEHSAIIDGHYKLIKFWKTNKEELYDLDQDIGEIHDLAGTLPEKRRELDEKLMDYLKKMHAEIPDPGIRTGEKLKKNKKASDDDD